MRAYRPDNYTISFSQPSPFPPSINHFLLVSHSSLKSVFSLIFSSSSSLSLSPPSSLPIFFWPLAFLFLNERLDNQVLISLAPVPIHTDISPICLAATLTESALKSALTPIPRMLPLSPLRSYLSRPCIMLASLIITQTISGLGGPTGRPRTFHGRLTLIGEGSKSRSLIS